MKTETTLLERLAKRAKMNRQYKNGGMSNKIQQYSEGGTPTNPPGNLWEIDPDQYRDDGTQGRNLINRNKIPEGYEFSGIESPTQGRLYNPIGTPVKSAMMQTIPRNNSFKPSMRTSNSDRVVRNLNEYNAEMAVRNRPDLITDSSDDKNNMNDISLMKKGGMFNQMQQYQKGGMNLPGGQMQPIPGSDAVEFVGNKHDQAGMGSDSGILLDDNTEVEGGETMDQVTMKKGGARDYFFSDHLKKGGVSYANMHKNILQSGGNQDDVDTLARMQEYAAGRTVDKIAKNGGERKKLEHGGPHPELDDSRLRDLIRQQGAAMLQNPLLNRRTFEEPKLMGRSLSDYPEEKVEEKAEEKSSAKNKSGSKTSNRNTRPELPVASNKYLNEYGTIPGSQPGVKIGDNQYYLDDPELQKYIEEHENFGEEWMDSIDPKVLEAAGITDYSELTSDPSKVTAYQKAWNAANPDNKVQVDGDFGEQTIRTGIIGGKKEEDKDGTDKTGDDEDGSGIKRDPVINKTPERGPNLVGAAQFIPAAMAFADKPDYMKDPDLVKASTIEPERIAKTRLDTVDYNDQLAANANDAAAMNRFIETSGGGPASIVNRMAMYGKKQQGDERIKAQETRANTAILNQQASLEQQRRATNAGNALSASAQNVAGLDRASQINVRNKMSVDEFRAGADAATKDRRLMGVDSAVSNLAQMRRDSLQYDAQERLAQAISGQTGVYNREQEKPEEPETAKTGGYRKKMEDKKKMQDGGIKDLFKNMKKNREMKRRKNMGKRCGNSKTSKYTRTRR